MIVANSYGIGRVGGCEAGTIFLNYVSSWPAGSASIRSSVTSTGMLPVKFRHKIRQAVATTAIRAGSLVRTTMPLIHYNCMSIPHPAYQYKGGAYSASRSTSLE